MDLRPGIVQVNVTDLGAARAFYGKTLGVPLREPFGPEGPFELDLASGPPVLVYAVERSVPVDHGRQTGVTLVLHTDDLEGTVALWRERGVAFVPIAWSEDASGIAPCPYGRFIAFRDPFGNVHELLEPAAPTDATAPAREAQARSTVPDLLREAHEHWSEARRLASIGRRLQGRARFEDARRVLERSLALDARDAEAWAQLAYVHLRSLRDEEGRATLRRGVDATGSSWLETVLAEFADAEEGRLVWEKVAGDTDPPVVAARLAHRFSSTEDKAQALDELLALQAAHPDDRRVRDSALWILYSAASQKAVPERDLVGLARPLIEAAIEADPLGPGGWWFLCQFLQLAGDWPGLLDATARGLAHLPDDETLMQLRGRAWRESGDVDRAVAWFQRAIGAKPSFAGARVDLGRLYETTGRIELAEEVFREIPLANPAYAAGPVSVALFLARQGRMEEARPMFASAWPRLHPFFQAGLRRNPEASALLSAVEEEQPS
jgi:tetratricopeptide (TPR) repeat protein/catechol 2,3-dioxygenase-like lactoylglutathione lyase family enzyme